MTTISLAHGASRALAAALVTFDANGHRIDYFVEKKLRTAITVAKCNAGGNFPDGTVIALPKDFSTPSAMAMTIAVSDLTGFVVTTHDQPPLSKKVVEKAKANYARFKQELPQRAKRRNEQMTRKCWRDQRYTRGRGRHRNYDPNRRNF